MLSSLSHLLSLKRRTFPHLLGARDTLLSDETLDSIEFPQAAPQQRVQSLLSLSVLSLDGNASIFLWPRPLCPCLPTVPSASDRSVQWTDRPRFCDWRDRNVQRFPIFEESRSLFLAILASSTLDRQLDSRSNCTSGIRLTDFQGSKAALQQVDSLPEANYFHFFVRLTSPFKFCSFWLES